jgi:putative glutamine amidotransferase
MNVSMSAEEHSRPRVGIPFRTSHEEETGKNADNLENYLRSVRKAGGSPERIPLQAVRSPADFHRDLDKFDAFVLPGSPQDIEPALYGSTNQGKSKQADTNREATDFAILQHALSNQKPVLAICYGCQSLNVHLKGTLFQDIRSETGTKTAHRKKDLSPALTEDPRHNAILEPGSQLAELARGTNTEINSSHHQAIKKVGNNLRATAHAPDGIIEGVEWAGDANWVVGVQWHPERMAGDPLAEALFRSLVLATRAAAAPR